jgi:hypothetical protein
VVQHDLGERHQGHAESGNVSLIRAVLLAAAFGLVAGSCGGAPGNGQIVLVSGRDDHGLVSQAAVGLAREPGERTYPASLPDGTFARVLERRSEWLKIRAIGGDQAGWVNEFYLRDAAVGLTPPRQVRFLDASVRDGAVLVLVRPRDDPGGDGVWVAAGSLREVGAAP